MTAYYEEETMDEYDGPGEGWRELRRDESVGGREYVAHGNIDSPFDSAHTFTTWVREEPVPPLPTAPHTHIITRWRKDGSEHELIRRLTGKWRSLKDGCYYTDDQLRGRITGFEVLAEPVDHERAHGEKMKAIVRRETAKAVLDRVRKRVLGQTSWSRTGMEELAREFGVSS